MEGRPILHPRAPPLHVDSRTCTSESNICLVGNPGIPLFRGRTANITSPSTSAACGLENLHIGIEYLLSGKVAKYGPMSSTCDLLGGMEWEQVPSEI
uniref:Sushi domain-containing protein n=1 Tax=Steinernema glaseri TaxID=37863 RepID=A0A1I7ZI12_9BILA